MGPSARRAAALAALGADAALLFAAPHANRNGDSEYRYRADSDVFYLTGWEDPECAVLLRPGSDHPFILFVQPKDATMEVWTGFRHGVDGARTLFGADVAFPISELPSRLGVLLQGYETLHYRVGSEHDESVFRAIRSAGRAGARNGLPLPWRFHDPRRLLGELRLTKAADEIATLRRAAEISAAAHILAMNVGTPGTPEYVVEATVDGHFRAAGGNGPGYTTIVGGGRNACTLHYITNRDVLKAGDLCLVDAGCEVDCYTADLTRTWPVSGRFSPAQRRLYEIVLASQIAAIDCARAGHPFRQMHDVAVRVLTEGMVRVGLLAGEVGALIREEKHRKYYMHGTGHWLGLDVHDESAYQVGLSSRLLAAGMVVTVEPGLYVPADAVDAPSEFRGIGIRIEDDVLVTEGDPDVLTRACPKSVDAIEAACRRGAVD